MDALGPSALAAAEKRSRAGSRVDLKAGDALSVNILLPSSFSADMNAFLGTSDAGAAVGAVLEAEGGRIASRNLSFCVPQRQELA